MARRQRSASRVSFAVLAAAGVVAIAIWAVKSHNSPQSDAGTGNRTDVAQTGAGENASDLSKTTSTAAGAISSNTDRQLVKPDAPLTDSPTTLPATTQPGMTAIPPRQAPEGDAETIFKNATAKRDAGDLVTARDMVNDALLAGKFNGSDVQDAKTFIGGLNEKIILGTQKFSADPYNKTWKVEPGTALVKLAKRFDVTAELLCRVNGLSSPNKLKSGITIKAIQGPFHLVVSKSLFTAEIYLGNPGGPKSMYVKTVRVGLGSDGSTPTGTWQVDTGKIVNPVYYSARGEGVIAADDPKNPLGERWIPLKGIEGDCVGKESYGIHGTIDPGSIGKNMSQGCIRLASDDINLLYDLLIEQKSLVKVVD